MGIATAIVIGAGISAASQVISAHKQAGASKDAAKTQAASADKALDVQKEMYQQQRTDEAPYLGLGAGAVGALQHGLGLTPPPPATPPPTGLQTMATGVAQAGAIRRPGPPQGALGMMSGGPQPNSGPSGGVPMRSPNGQTTRVAPDQVAHYQSLGAQVV